MNRFFLITNKHRDEDLEMTGRICRYLKEKGAVCVCQSEEEDRLPDRTQCVLVLGGDGTLLRSVHLYGGACRIGSIR